jgi:2-C-methyl-D-erythritol 4-phosphate cytidylyltransferase
VIQTNNEEPANPPLGEGRVGVLTLSMSDTVKEVVDGKVRRTVPRETVVQVIGPWVFDREALVDVLAAVASAGTPLTDMIGVCEAGHVRVRALAAP